MTGSILELVKATLRKRLPRGPNNYRPSETLLEHYAREIISAGMQDKARFGVSADGQLIRAAIKNLRSVEENLFGLEFATRLDITVFLETKRPSEGKALIKSHVEIRRLIQALEHELRNKRHRRKANSRANYRAASVASALRTIWAQHERELNRKRYGPDPISFFKFLELEPSEQGAWLEQQERYEVFIRDFAPRTQKHNRPAAFGVCLEEVFGSLGILSATGAPVSAATALDALTHFEGQE